MTKNITIKNFNSLQTISINPEIKSIEHYSNQRELFDYLLSKEYRDFDLQLEQLILIECDIKIKIESETEELLLKYQVVLEKSYNTFLQEYSNSETYNKFIARLTDLPDFKSETSKTLFETAIGLLESQNNKFRIITFQEFSYFDVNSLIAFDYDTCKFGLFICNYQNSHIRYLTEKKGYSFENDRSNIVKKIAFSSKSPESNTYVVSLLPSPRINLYDKALPSISGGFNSNMSYRRNFYDNQKFHGFIEGPYTEISAIFDNEDALRKIVINYIKDDQKRNTSNYNDSIEDALDFTSWSDDRDTDQQPEDFWNQF